MNLSTMAPTEIDEMLASLYYARQSNDATRETVLNTIHSKVGSREYIRGDWHRKSRYVNNMTDDAAIAELRRRLDAGEVNSWDVEYYEQPLEQLAALDAADARIEAEAQPLEAEYRSRPWSRFFRVTSSDGHIHSSMSCGTCYWSTTYGWRPDLSGRTEAEAVAELGPALCSVCFPSAPVDWTGGKLTKTGKVSAARR